MPYIMDYIVGLMADTRPGKNNQIHPIYAIGGILPMWYFTKWTIDLQVICTILITLNSLDRLLWPSNYSPTTSSRPGILYSPFTGRTLATFAEYFQYFMWATWVNEPFQGSILGNVVVFGETVCWCGLLFQSKSIHWCEDSTWTIHGALMTFFSKTLA